MSKVLIAEGLSYNLLSVSQLMAKGIHLEADSTTQEFKLYNGKGGLYIGKAVLKNNVFVLDFVPDLGTADSDGIVTFTSWTHPPDLDPDFSPEGFCSKDNINSSRDNIGSSRDNIGSSRDNIGSSRNNGSRNNNNRHQSLGIPPPSHFHRHLTPTAISFPPPSHSHRHLTPTSISLPPPIYSHHHLTPTTISLPPPLTPTTISLPPPSHSHHHLTPTTISLPPPSHYHHHLTPTTISLPLPSHSHFHLTPTTISLPPPSHSHHHHLTRWGIHLGIERNYNVWKIFDVHSKETVAARDVIFYERLTLPKYLANLAEDRDPTGGFRGDRAFASAADEADWDEQNVDEASEEAGPLPYCSVDVPMDDENPRESANANVFYHFADNGYVTPAEVNTNEAERIGPNFIPDPETGDEAAYPTDTTLPRYTQSGLQILGLVTAVHGMENPKEPATVQQALGGEHREKWCEAMDKELKALKERNTWKVVPIGVARNKTVLTGKWVFRVKTKADGTIDKFKARWVVRVFDQEHGRDFTETFALVSRHTSLRILLAIAAMKKKKPRQIDVANAFIYAPVDAEIFVELPHGSNGEPNHVCQLLKSLYGLKQAPRLCQQYLHARLTRIGFRELQKNLTLTISSTVTQYLGLNIQEGESAIYLNAAKYADTIAKRFALTPTTISTPYRYTAGSHKEDFTPPKPARIRDYQRKLGCLLFAAVTCRLDLSYSASQLATYLKRPEVEHMTELDRALHYLVSTPTISLTYYKNRTTTPKLIGYVDADHAGDSDNRRSRTGDIYRLEPIGPISWQSSKQELIALSSAEAEYIALCSATKEGLYLRELLEEAKLAQLPSFSLFCDNQSAIRIANKNGFANRTKHIALRYFFVKDEIEKGILELSYCPTSEMAADYLTKKLGKQKFEYCMLLTGQSHVTSSDTPEAKGSVGNN
ncbi:unnamed protein product [Closterium sp. NIES-53]